MVFLIYLLGKEVLNVVCARLRIAAVSDQLPDMFYMLPLINCARVITSIVDRTRLNLTSNRISY